MNYAMGMVKSVTPSGNLLGSSKPVTPSNKSKEKHQKHPSKLADNKEVNAALKIQKWYRTSKRPSKRGNKCTRCCGRYFCCCCPCCCPSDTQTVPEVKGRYITAPPTAPKGPTLLKMSKQHPIGSPKPVTQQPKKPQNLDIRPVAQLYTEEQPLRSPKQPPSGSPLPLSVPTTTKSPSRSPVGSPSAAKHPEKLSTSRLGQSPASSGQVRASETPKFFPPDAPSETTCLMEKPNAE